MPRATYVRKGLIAGGHTADQVARRAAAIERVRALLAVEPASSRALADQLELNTHTVHRYLLDMEQEGTACKAGRHDKNGRLMWKVCTPEESIATEHGNRALITRARQVGMARDPLVQALFGPAGRVA